MAKWAGHSVEVLTRVYTGRMFGTEDVWINQTGRLTRQQVFPVAGHGPAAAAAELALGILLGVAVGGAGGVAVWGSFGRCWRGRV